MNLNKLKEEFTALYGEGKVDVFFAPGRVNLIGEHIDYNGGLVMPATIRLEFTGLNASVMTLSLILFRKMHQIESLSI
jgi:galactokinase (EC 2.7.1.6)